MTTQTALKDAYLDKDTDVRITARGPVMIDVYRLVDADGNSLFRNTLHSKKAAREMATTLGYCLKGVIEQKRSRYERALEMAGH